MGKPKFEYSGNLDIDEAISYLEGIVEGLKVRRVTLSENGDGVSLTPRNQIKFCVEASGGDEKQSLNLELRWRAELRDEAAPTLKVSTAPLPDPEAEQADSDSESESESKSDD